MPSTISLIFAGGGYPSSVVTRAHSSKVAVTNAAPAGAAATAPARERVTTATVDDAAMPQNFPHISVTMFSLTVLATPPPASAAPIASHLAEPSPARPPE